jgi:HEPN domain-containing protein
MAAAIGLEVLLNDFAVRSFREPADQDYIVARLAYRAELFPQFHWSSLQALEKYLKTILLLNRIDARAVKHNLGLALQLTEKLPFGISLSESTRSFIAYLDEVGAYRYLESSYVVLGPRLLELDRAVWEIRRYCKTINYQITLADGSVKSMLPLEIAAIDHGDRASPRHHRLPGGVLEKILDRKTHPAREALVWQNAYFGVRRRARVNMPSYFHAVNAPLLLHPEVLDAALEYVFIPPSVVSGYRELLRLQRPKVSS